MRRKKLIIVILSITVFVLYLAKIFLVAETAVSGMEVASIDREIKRIMEENKYLKRMIFEETSLETITKKAKEQGFTEPTYIYLQ